jgi:hypothetical protein
MLRREVVWVVDVWFRFLLAALGGMDSRLGNEFLSE